MDARCLFCTDGLDDPSCVYRGLYACVRGHRFHDVCVACWSAHRCWGRFGRGYCPLCLDPVTSEDIRVLVTLMKLETLRRYRGTREFTSAGPVLWDLLSLDEGLDELISRGMPAIPKLDAFPRWTRNRVGLEVSDWVLFSDVPEYRTLEVPLREFVRQSHDCTWGCDKDNCTIARFDSYRRDPWEYEGRPLTQQRTVYY